MNEDTSNKAIANILLKIWKTYPNKKFSLVTKYLH